LFCGCICLSPILAVGDPCGTEKLGTGGAVEPRRETFFANKNRHAAVNAASKLISVGDDERAGK
jgi:hypothetical protein